MVQNLAVSHTVAATCLGQQIGGVSHAFHAARYDHIRRTREEKIVGKHGCLHAGATHLVDGRCASGNGYSGFDRSLTCRSLSLTGGRTQPI